MIIEANNTLSIYYNHFIPKEIDEDGGYKPIPDSPSYTSDGEIDSFVLYRKYIPNVLHIKKVPDFSQNMIDSNNTVDMIYEIHLVDYLLVSKNLNFMRMLLQVISDYKEEKIGYDYNIIENHPQMFV